MNVMFRYYRNRMDGAQIDRDNSIRLFTKRAVKSLSRIGPDRVISNRFIGLINTVERVRPGFSELVTQNADRFSRSAPKSTLRLKLMTELMTVTVPLNENDLINAGAALVFAKYHDQFQEQDDARFIQRISYHMGVSRRGCGHYHGSSRNVFGSIHDSGVVSYHDVCPACYTNLINAGTHEESNEVLIESAFAVDGMSADGDRVRVDRRDPAYRLNETSGLYVHQDYNPYRNIIAPYHSSKNKGFSVIESPWFRSHRRAFGCELEVQLTRGDLDKAAGKIHETLNPSLKLGEYCYFERDGSVGHGFEIITQPAGLDIHRKKFELFLKNPDLISGLRSHEGGSCGFHVHVGRQYVTQSQIYRLQSFLNDVRNEALIKKIARRYSNGYSRFKYEMAKFSPHNKQTGDRYEALNVTGSHTIEFRIFRGSLRYESIMAALEFVNALLDFCTPGAVSIMEFNAIGFQRFVMRLNNRTDTKYLRSYLSLNVETDNEQRQAA